MLAYILDAVSRTTGVEWLGTISPVTWAFGAHPIITGLDFVAAAGLLDVAALLQLGALVTFNRRDVGMN